MTLDKMYLTPRDRKILARVKSNKETAWLNQVQPGDFYIYASWLYFVVKQRYVCKKRILKCFVWVIVDDDLTRDEKKFKLIDIPEQNFNGVAVMRLTPLESY